MTGIKFAFPTQTKDIIVRYYKNVAPGVVYTSAPFSAPHTAQVFVPENIQSVAYTFQFWTTDDGVTPLAMLTEWAIDGDKLLSGAVEGFYEYVVGRGEELDPAVDATELHDERLAGQKYLVIMRGTGPRSSSEVTDIATGGFALVNPGETFQAGDVITVVLMGAGASGSTGAGNGPAGQEGVIVVTASGVVDAAFYNKHAAVKPAGLITTLTFQAFDSIPSGTTMAFSTSAFTASNRYLALQFAPGDSVPFFGKDRGVIHLGSHEYIKLYFYSASGLIKCLVLEDGTNYARVGERLTSDYKQRLNAMLADGETEYNVADFPRLFTELTADQKTDYTTWNAVQEVTVAGNVLTKYPYKRKFAISNDGLKFRFPDRRGMAMRVLDSFTGSDSRWLSQGAGGFSAEELLSHDHEVQPPNANSQNGYGKTTTGGDSTENEITKYKTSKTGGTSQRVDSEGVYALIGI